MSDSATCRIVDYDRPWLYPLQSQALFDPKRYSLIEASTKSGKTTGALIWLTEQAMRGQAGQNFWWVAPVFKQAKIAFRRMKAALPRAHYTKNETELTITLLNGAVIWFMSGENPDTLYGEDVYAAVIDEASRLKEPSWHAVRSTLTATRGPVRIIGNVKGKKNWFYRLCRLAQSGTPDMGYHKITAYDAVDAKVLAAEEIEDAKTLLPEEVFNELYLADASDDASNPFGISFIAACTQPLSTAKSVCFGLDLAKKKDWAVFIALDKYGQTTVFERWQGPWKSTIAKVVALAGKLPGYGDATGVGDAIVEELKGEGVKVDEWVFTSSSKQILMEGLTVAIQSEQISYPDGPIADELESFEYEYTRTGVRYTAPPGLHDDCVCSLALAWAKWKETVTVAATVIDRPTPRYLPERRNDGNGKLEDEPRWSGGRR